jgi:predicted nucleotidyltransferase
LDEPYYETIGALDGLLAEFGLPWVLIGGVAVSLVARERTTKDVDGLILFDTAETEALISAAKRHGFDERFPDMAAFARQSRVLALIHRPTGTPVDIALGALPFEEEVIARATKIELGPATVNLPTPEDLVIMKGIARRPRDMEDIRTLVQVYPGMDSRRVEYWLEQYAELLETPEIWYDVKRILDG